MLEGTGDKGLSWILTWNVLNLLIIMCSAQYRNRTATTCTYDVNTLEEAESSSRGFLRLDCEPDSTAPQVIHILNAIYGVSLYTTCTVSSGDTCKVDGSHFAHIRECNGKRNCKIPTNARDLECPGGGDVQKSHYLQVEFQCVPGILHPDEDSICGGVGYPDENYDDPQGDSEDLSERRKRNANLPQDDLPHIENAHYRVTFPAAFLISPNYPNNYPNYMHCECYLQTHNDAYIIFRVLDFEIEHGESCMYDYLQMSIGPLSERYCDIVPRGTTVRTQTNFIHLIMKSDDSVSSTGVWAEYWGQRTDNTRVPVRSKCGPYTGSEIPDSIPPFPPENTGVSASISVPTQAPTTTRPPRIPKPPPPERPPPERPPQPERPPRRPPVPQPRDDEQPQTTDTSSPDNSPKASDNEGGGIDMSIIIGAAAAGGLLIIILVVVAIILCCRRRTANTALKSRTGVSRSMSSLSGHLPPAPNVPAPKIPTAPYKGQEYVGLNSDHVSYKSPPGSSYTTIDSKSNLPGLRVLPDPLQLRVPPAPPYTQYPNNIGGHPAGFINPEYSETQEEHIYAEIYDEITKYSPEGGVQYENHPQSYTNNAYTKGAMMKSNSFNNFLNTGAQQEKIHVNIINGSNT